MSGTFNNYIGNSSGSGSGGSGVTDHSLLTNLDVDSHLQYLLLSGRSGGQTIINDLTLSNILKESISTVTDIVAATGIVAIDNQTLIIQSSTAGDCDITANPQIIAGTSGQSLRLVGNSNTKTVTFSTGDGLLLNNGQSFTLGLNDVLKLIFVGSTWLEESRSNNN